MSGRPSEMRLRWEVFRCRRQSDTRTQYLLELARSVVGVPSSADPPPLLEIGTRAGGSALLMLRILDLVYPAGSKRPLVLTVDPYGTRPYEGAPFVYDDRHYRAMKRTLASHANHIHYMMDSELFLALLDRLYLWIDGVRRSLSTFSLVYLDGKPRSRSGVGRDRAAPAEGGARWVSHRGRHRLVRGCGAQAAGHRGNEPSRSPPA